MTDKTISSGAKVGGDYFYLRYLRSSDKNLEYYLDQFNIDDYYIYKFTDRVRRVTDEDLYHFNYSGYIFFKKDIYNCEEIDDWIDYLKEYNMSFKFLTKPFPPMYIREKIRIIE